jgi:ribose-phosphate pyrophosphokinase
MEEKKRNQIVLCSLDASSYMADSLYDELTDMGVYMSRMKIERDCYQNGEKYYKLCIDNAFSLLGKTAIYVGSVVSDSDILDIQRVGATLAHSGIKRRIFVIPFLAYSTSSRATSPGEVVVAKSNEQIFSTLGATDDNNVYVFLDLHDAGLLHYFEGSCLRIELYGINALTEAVRESGVDLSKLVMGAPNLRNSKWVNSYANEFGTPIAFIAEGTHNVQKETPTVIGDVKGKHVIIYNDLITDSKLIVDACEVYLSAGATHVDVILSHFAVTVPEEIQKIIDSPITKIYATNSHPVTQCDLVQNCEKFKIVDVTADFVQCLFEMLPSDRFPRKSF